MTSDTDTAELVRILGEDCAGLLVRRLSVLGLGAAPGDAGRLTLKDSRPAAASVADLRKIASGAKALARALRQSDNAHRLSVVSGDTRN